MIENPFKLDKIFNIHVSYKLIKRRRRKYVRKGKGRIISLLKKEKGTKGRAKDVIIVIAFNLFAYLFVLV